MIKKISLNILVVITLFLGCSGPPSISVLPLLDTFQQQGNKITAKMDILWVIDNSRSMDDEQKALKENFNSFITSFIGKGYDYRIAVITTDAYYTETGKYSEVYNAKDPKAAEHPVITAQTGPYTDFTIQYRNNEDNEVPYDRYVTSKFVDGDLTKDTEDTRSGYHLIDSSDNTIDFKLYDDPLNNTVYEIGHADYIRNNVKNIFAVNSNVGTRGFGAESGLSSIQTALNTPANKEFNFPRPDAHLAIIVVSDEEDQIQNEENNRIQNPKDENYYNNILKQKANPTYGYSFYAIVKFNNAQCPNIAMEDQQSQKDPQIGYRYIALADLSGGIAISICDNFAESLSNIAQIIIEKTVEFPLKNIPVNPNRLQVSVKNPGEITPTILPQNVDNGWTYNPSANSIVFHGTSIPAQDSEINILYDSNGL